MLRIAARNFWCGMLDSVRGCYKIFLLDRPTDAGDVTGSAVSSSVPANQPARTTLALRRENRPKQRETSNSRPDIKPKAWIRLGQCIFSNLICILLFHYLLLPLIEFLAAKCYRLISTNVEPTQYDYEWVLTILRNLLSALWVLPVFVITRVVNSIWFQDIANAAFRRRAKTGTQMSFSRSVADFCYAILLETVFLLQTYFVGFLPMPYLNTFLKIVHTGLLYGLYSFEYVWMSQGVEMHQRLARIEHNYPYFFGFGLPLTLVTMVTPSAIISGCVFGLCFPLFIVSSFEAKPPTVSADWEPIRFFYPSVLVSDKISMLVLNKAKAKVQFSNRPID